MANFKAKPISKQEIRELAKAIRKKCGLEDIHKIPVCLFF